MGTVEQDLARYEHELDLRDAEDMAFEAFLIDEYDEIADAMADPKSPHSDFSAPAVNAMRAAILREDKDAIHLIISDMRRRFLAQAEIMWAARKRNRDDD